MITYTNIMRRDAVPFSEYLKLPAYSQSFLKKEINGLAPGVDVTDNMRVGTMVDNILTEPERVDMRDPLFVPCRKMAATIRQKFPFIDKFDRQVSYTAVANYNGFALNTKARLDWLLPKHAVIDCKVTTCKPSQFNSLINFMGYDNQLWHYGKCGEVPAGYLIIYSRPVADAFLIPVDVSKPINLFWADKIEKFGTISDAA